MKILFVRKAFESRGGDIVFSQIVRALKEQKHDCDVYGFREKGKSIIELGSEHLWSGLVTKSIEVDHYDNPNRQIIEFIKKETEFLLTVKNYDRIIIDNWFIVYSAIKTNLVNKNIWQLVQQDPVFEPENDEAIFKSEFFHLLNYYPFNRIIVSQAISDKFLQRDHQKHPSLNLYIDDKYHNSKFEVKDNPVLKIIASAVDFNVTSKGLPELLSIIEKLNNSFPTELTLLTKKPLALPKTKFNIQVISANTPSEIFNILNQNDVFVSTSIKEGFGLSIAEAVTIGMPTVALDAVGNREFYNGKNYKLCQSLDEVCDEVLSLRDLSLRKALSKNAQGSMKKYQLSETIKQFKKIINIQ